ncbi:transposase [Vibrio tapetis subsp. quintayensis]|nr:transposase [Vibrio tapetis]MDN3679932.1 transposase [Vibrio tapetis subsp. quintayensis]
MCGDDELTGKSYHHRRDWIEKKMYALSAIYCIDICSYAIMSNHYHLVVHVDKNEAKQLSLSDVVMRWEKAHKLPVIIARWQEGTLVSKAERDACELIIEQWRSRLFDLSWFMKELNHGIACQANKEDNCTGHFWESRFKSQALLDESALAAAMVYVDLNPVRAGVAKTLETSDFTSIKHRLKSLERNQRTTPGLAVFIGNSSHESVKGIPFRLIDYIELVDWSGRQHRNDKAMIGWETPPILERISVNQMQWLKACSTLERKRASHVGRTISMQCLQGRYKRVNGFHLDQ